MREPGSGPVDQIYTGRERIDLRVGFWQDQRTVSEGDFVSSVRLIRVAFIATLISLSSTPLPAADLAGAASPAELGRRYSQALARKDTNAYFLLICWDRVLPQDRKSLESGFTWEASNNVTDLRFLTLRQMDQEARKVGGEGPTRKPVKRDGVTFDFNLPVIGYLVYQFKSQDGKSKGNGAVPIGMKGGRYFVTTRAPLP
jgi:hypothetical protein